MIVLNSWCFVMTTITSAAELVAALRDSQLVDPDQLSEITTEVLQQFPDPRELANVLIQWDWLTPFQAEKILAGRGLELLVGPYRLLAPLGEGGMGQVFKALHLRLERIVALKIIRQEHLADAEAVLRFRREARAAAQLQHPNVVLVFDADQVGDCHYLAMEYVDGVDLGKLVKQSGPLEIDLACDCIRQAALGLQHAHEAGLVHRDIKPSNLLLTRVRPGAGSSSLLRRPPQMGVRNEPTAAAPPVVKVLDMGLARMVNGPERIDPNHPLTEVGMVMGTPDYIAPEQARDPHSADIRADLYGLGCTLYFLLVGKPPFPGGSMVEKLLRHQLDCAQPVGTLRSEVRPALAAIVQRLMQKNPADRPQTPAELVAALEKLNPQSPAAMTPVRRPKRTKASVTMNIPVLPCVAVAEPELPPKSEQVAAAYFNWSGGRVAPPDTVPEPRCSARLRGHNGWAVSAAFAPNHGAIASGDVSGELRLWNFGKHRQGDFVVPEAHASDLTALAFAPDSMMLASASGSVDGMTRIWDVREAGPRLWSVLQGPRTSVEALAWSPDGQSLATAGGDRLVRLWNVAPKKGRELALLKGHADTVKTLAWSPDGQMLASGSLDGSVRLWAPKGRLWSREAAVLRAHTGPVRSVAWSANGHVLASASMDQTVRLWDATTGKPTAVTVFKGHASVVRLVAFRPDGRTLISVDDVGRVLRWDSTTGAIERSWQLPNRVLCSVGCTGDGRYVVVGTTEGNVLVYRLSSRQSASQSANSTVVS
jgi:serine/threonine protein kinase